MSLEAHPNLAELLKKKSVLITGGTGSFGKALLRQLLDHYEPRRIILFARGEYAHSKISAGLSDAERERVRFFIGDVRDQDRLAMAFRGVDVVFHAAAQKQVPLAEYNPFECIRTNVIGAENVVNAAIRAKVPRVIALSTDKAVNPTNLYGASKLASDKIFVAANALGSPQDTRFSVVRYGNVIGSRGSVIPFFMKKLEQGATSLPVTDMRMTRFWLTLEQAVTFSLNSMARMRGGEIFVPKIPSMRMPDLLEALAPGMEAEIVGIRPGEKLHECMIDEHSARSCVDIDDCYVIEPEWSFWSRQSFREEGHPLVPENFEYSSDQNPDFLNPQQMRNIIDQISIELD